MASVTGPDERLGRVKEVQMFILIFETVDPVTTKQVPEKKIGMLRESSRTENPQ